MTNTSVVRSAFPPAITDLIPRAEALTGELGRPPTRNELMRTLHIGDKKANALLAAIGAPGPAAEAVPVSPAGPAPDMAWPPTPHAPATLNVAKSPSAAEPAPTPTLAVPDEVASAELRRPRSWPVFLLALPAFIAVWSGWVGLGALTGFGIVHPLPGIWDAFRLNTAITLPIGVEAYAAYAIRVWLSPAVTARTRTFAKWSTIAALVLGAGGQIAYHLMAAQHVTAAPWQITTAVASLPVAVVFAGSALAHLVHTDRTKHQS